MHLSLAIPWGGGGDLGQALANVRIYDGVCQGKFPWVWQNEWELIDLP